MSNKQTFNGNEFVVGQSAKFFESRLPVNGRGVSLVAEARQPEVDPAAKAAGRAQHGRWGRLSLPQRVDLLYAVADEINRRFDAFLESEVAHFGVSARHSSGRRQLRDLTVCKVGDMLVSSGQAVVKVIRRIAVAGSDMRRCRFLQAGAAACAAPNRARRRRRFKTTYQEKCLEYIRRGGDLVPFVDSEAYPAQSQAN